MKVLIERERQTRELDFSGTAGELLAQLNINPEVVVISRNGEIVTEDEPLETTDEIKLISVVSGG